MKDISTIHGAEDATGLRVGIVVSVYHESVTESLSRGAIDALVNAGAVSDEIVIIRVPGAFEVPLAARKAAESGKFDALVCVGGVVNAMEPMEEWMETIV